MQKHVIITSDILKSRKSIRSATENRLVDIFWHKWIIKCIKKYISRNSCIKMMFRFPYDFISILLLSAVTFLHDLEWRMLPKDLQQMFHCYSKSFIGTWYGIVMELQFLLWLVDRRKSWEALRSGVGIICNWRCVNCRFAR